MTTNATDSETSTLHFDSIVVDALLVGAPAPSFIDRLKGAGYDVVNWTIANHTDSLQSAINKIVTFYWLMDERPNEVSLVRSAADLDIAHPDGTLRVLLGFQGAEPLGHGFHNLVAFHAMGVRVMQLTYNDANLLGSGCVEPNDTGLTHFGIQVVRECHRLNMVVDLTHAGKKTTMDAMALSDRPVIFSHSNAKSLRDNPRNIDDEQIKALAATGGVIGIAGFADFVGDTHLGQPSLSQYFDHIEYVANLVGIDHVGIGSDIMSTAGAGGLWWNANTKRRYPEVCGAMDEHMHGVSGFEDWSEYPQVTEGLLKRGFSDSDVRQIIGGNFLRVFRQILG